MACSVEVFCKPLMTSVVCYHEACFPEDPNGEDPLVEFGAVGGEIPNFDPARAAALRDALIRYNKPHRQFEWEHLGQLLEEVAKMDAKTAPCFPFTDPTISRQFFCLSLEPLSRIAHAVVAVQQILQALTIFLGKDPKTSFMLDPDYGLLGLLERSAYEVEMRFMLSCLQRRLGNGNKHILTYFQSIRRTLVNEDWSDIVSSADSMLPEIHREFGTMHPTQEMYHLLLRPDYSRCIAMINDSARVGMMRRLNKEPREHYYCPR
jgi:hypothetical protein